MRELQELIDYYVINQQDIMKIQTECLNYIKNMENMDYGNFKYEEDKLVNTIFGDITDNIRMSIAFTKFVNEFFEFIDSFLISGVKEISLVIENYYVDRVYRDSYYTFFSNKHFEFKRNCKRITFFEGDVSEYLFGKVYKLQEKIIGNIIIRPIFPGTMGRTVIIPQKIEHKKAFIRTSSFTQTLLGNKLFVQGFPFSSQDTETMSCAENTVLNLMEFFGNRYGYYYILNPSDINNALSLISEQRVLPSLGMSYDQMSAILKKIGFSPIVYYKRDYNYKDFKRIFYSYIESGIPLPVAIKYEKKKESRTYKESHSVICIGHSEFDGNCDSVCSYIYKYEGVSIVNSADLNQEYVFMDDNLMPYQYRTFDNPITYNDVCKAEITGFIVPLYRRVFLEASYAFDVVQNLLLAIKDLIDLDNLSINGQKYCTDKNPVIIRLFLTTSRNFKEYKSKQKDMKVNKIVQMLPMPKFIWVGEYMLASQYVKKNKKAFGEVVVDATVSKYMREEGVLYARFPQRIAYKLPQDQSDIFFNRIENVINVQNMMVPDEFEVFKNNLL